MPTVRPQLHPRLRPHHQEGGRAARAVPGEPDAARHHFHLRLAVRRIADHHAGRDRAVAPPHAERAPLHRRGRGRLHGGRRREAADEARRLRGDAGLGLARSRQPRHDAGGLARRARHAVRAIFRRGVPRGACRRQAADRPARGRIHFGVRHEPHSRRVPVGRAFDAGADLSVRAHPRGARQHGQGEQAASGARLSAALRQSGDRQASVPDHGGVDAAAAEGIFRQDLSLDRQRGVRGASRHRHGADRRQDLCDRAARRVRRAAVAALQLHTPTARSSCSAIPIAPGRRRWATGASRSGDPPNASAVRWPALAVALIARCAAARAAGRRRGDDGGAGGRLSVRRGLCRRRPQPLGKARPQGQDHRHRRHRLDQRGDLRQRRVCPDFRACR